MEQVLGWPCKLGPLTVNEAFLRGSDSNSNQLRCDNELEAKNIQQKCSKTKQKFANEELTNRSKTKSKNDMCRTLGSSQLHWRRFPLLFEREFELRQCQVLCSWVPEHRIQTPSPSPNSEPCKKTPLVTLAGIRPANTADHGANDLGTGAVSLGGAGAVESASLGSARSFESRKLTQED